MKFTDKSTLEEILEFSGAEDVLLKHNVPCLGCPMAKLEMQNLNIGQVCAMYGIDLEKLLGDLNSAAKSYGGEEQKTAKKEK